VKVGPLGIGIAREDRQDPIEPVIDGLWTRALVTSHLIVAVYLRGPKWLIVRRICIARRVRTIS
jgi:hypothetical protein